MPRANDHLRELAQIRRLRDGERDQALAVGAPHRVHEAVDAVLEHARAGMPVRRDVEQQDAVEADHRELP
jgi:hypothetical protein